MTLKTLENPAATAALLNQAFEATFPRPRLKAIVRLEESCQTKQNGAISWTRDSLFACRLSTDNRAPSRQSFDESLGLALQKKKKVGNFFVRTTDREGKKGSSHIAR